MIGGSLASPTARVMRRVGPSASTVSSARFYPGLPSPPSARYAATWRIRSDPGVALSELSFTVRPLRSATKGRKNWLAAPAGFQAHDSTSSLAYVRILNSLRTRGSPLFRSTTAISNQIITKAVNPTILDCGFDRVLGADHPGAAHQQPEPRLRRVVEHVCPQ